MSDDGHALDLSHTDADVRLRENTVEITAEAVVIGDHDEALLDLPSADEITMRFPGGGR